MAYKGSVGPLTGSTVTPARGLLETISRIIRIMSAAQIERFEPAVGVSTWMSLHFLSVLYFLFIPSTKIVHCPLFWSLSF